MAQITIGNFSNLCSSVKSVAIILSRAQNTLLTVFKCSICERTFSLVLQATIRKKAPP